MFTVIKEAILFSFTQLVLHWEYSPWQIRYWQSSHLADILAAFELNKNFTKTGKNPVEKLIVHKT